MFTEAPTLEAREVTVRHGGVVANDAVSLQVARGEIVGLIGPNGAGKTTFVDAATGFVGFEGSILFDGHDVGNLRPHSRARLGMARTWQSVELFEDLTIAENAAMSAHPPTWRSLLLDLVQPRRHLSEDCVDAALDAVGLAAVADRYPEQLSLGQQKLAGLARALAAQPSIVLLDEPAAGLDSDESIRLGQQLRRIATSGPGLLLIDHDMDLVLDICDRVYVLEFGAVIASGDPADIRRDDRVVAAYLGSHLDDDVDASELDRTGT